MGANELGNYIRSRRKALNMNQGVLAEKINISQQYLSGIEVGKDIPTLGLIFLLAKALDVGSGYLVEVLEGTAGPESLGEQLKASYNNFPGYKRKLLWRYYEMLKTLDLTEEELGREIDPADKSIIKSKKATLTPKQHPDKVKGQGA